MNSSKNLRSLYQEHYLLAASASIIILGFIGSINVMLITYQRMTFWGTLAMFFTVLATMRFLAFFLACFPFKRIYESFITGVILQLIILLLFTLN